MSEQCKAEVPDGGRFVTFHQCTRKAVADGWCRQHHPKAEAERKAQARERDDAKWQQERLRIYGPRFFKVLREIADGACDDPVRRAQEVVNEFERRQ